MKKMIATMVLVAMICIAAFVYDQNTAGEIPPLEPEIATTLFIEGLSTTEPNVQPDPDVTSANGDDGTQAEITTAETTDTTSDDFTEIEGTVVNVKDFGAVGDGKTDDEAAIVKAINHAVKNLPATVYFPEGEYGLLSGGIYYKLPLGSGGLTFKGEGGTKSVIKYLENWTTPGSWVALRIMPVSTPQNIDEYLHDITFLNLGVYDTDPVFHAWTVEENGSKEETHGFDIQYCVRATVKNCVLDSIGDEAIDMVYCIDSKIIGNTVINSPGAGSSGGAISVGDGCYGVIVENNTVNGTINAEGKSNFGIAVESLVDPVKNVIIKNNTLKNIFGNAINLGAPNGIIDNIVAYNNKINDCKTGVKLMGTGEKSRISFKNTHIINCQIAFELDGGNSHDVVFDGFAVSAVSNRVIHIASPSSVGTVFKNGATANMQNTAVYNAGTDTLITDVTFDGIGLSSATVAAFRQYQAGSIKLENVTIKNCKNRRAISDVQTLVNTVIKQEETPGYVSIFGAETIKNCTVNRGVGGLKSGGIIDGLTLKTDSSLGSCAITLTDATNCIVQNCDIKIPALDAIRENGACDNNIFICNNTNAPIVTVGKNSLVID